MQVTCLPNNFFGRQVETQLFIKFNPDSFGYENEILYQSEFQALTYHFSTRF
jgi:hypothetical protein